MDDTESLDLLKTRLSIDATTEYEAIRILDTLNHIPACSPCQRIWEYGNMGTSLLHINENEANKETL